MPAHGAAPTLADTTGDLELKLSRPPAVVPGWDVAETLTAGEQLAVEPGTPEGRAPNGEEGAGHVAGVVELPLLRLLTLLLQGKPSSNKARQKHS